MKNNYPAFNEFSIINPVIISGVIEHYCDKKNISFKWPNDVFVNGKKICGILQELINSNNKKFLIIGIGINIISHPIISNRYQATNIFFETKMKPTTEEILKLIITSYEKFFSDLNSYNYLSFKKKADSMAIKLKYNMKAIIGDIGNTITKICIIEIGTYKIEKIIYFNSIKIYSKIFLKFFFKKLLNKGFTNKVALFSSVVPKYHSILEKFLKKKTQN